MLQKNIQKFRWVLFLPYSIYFNFHYLPRKQAIKLPVLFYVRPRFLKLSGCVCIENETIKTGMIKLGADVSPIAAYKIFRWQNFGTIIFKGRCVISHHSFVSCGKQSRIEFGDEASFSMGNRIIAHDKIVFAGKVRVSWDCTFIDTDFHPIIDLASNNPIPMTSPIQIGYGSWIGHNSIVSKGVKIPENTIVASGSVVKGRFKQPNTIIGGNPAVVLDDGYKRDDT